MAEETRTTFNDKELECPNPDCKSHNIGFNRYTPVSKPDEVCYTRMQFICHTCKHKWEETA